MLHVCVPQTKRQIDVKLLILNPDFLIFFFHALCCPAPLLLCVQQDDGASEQEECENNTDLCDNKLAPPQIKEEQEEELWSAPTGEKQEDPDTKDSVFNIIYVLHVCRQLADVTAQLLEVLLQ